MSTRAQRFARQCLSTLQRLSRRLSALVRLFPGFAALMLVLVALLVEALVLSWPASIPWSSFLPVVVLAGLFLPPRWLGVVLLVTGALLAYDGARLGWTEGDFVGAVVVIALMAAMMSWLALSRAPLGV